MFGYFTEYSWITDVYFGNTIGAYLESFIIFVGLFIAFEIFQRFFLLYFEKFANRTNLEFDNFLIETIKCIKPTFYWLLSFYFAVHYLEITGQFKEFLDVGLVILVVFQIIKSTTQLINLVTKSKVKTNKSGASGVYALRILINVSLWVFGGIFVLSNLGINVTSLVAGLGIGGVAVALAVQNVLEDLFSSFVIYFDKPFKIGDFIIVGDHMGTVEKIGIKTTRLRALEGEEIVISNKELTSARIQNYRLLKKRRVEIFVGVAYETPKAKLEKISGMIKEVIESVENVTFEFAFIDKFDDSAVTYKVVYFVNSDVYIDYMSANQSIHIGIMDKFKKSKIEIAYPTRVIYNKKG